MTRLLSDTMQCDNPPSVGLGVVFLGVEFFNPLVNATSTRNAASDYSVNVAASNAAIVGIQVTSGMIRKLLGLSDPILGDAAVPKGLKITNMDLHYQITTNPLTIHTVRVDRMVFANNVANAITSILANGANGLQTAAQANPYTTRVALTTPAFEVTDDAVVNIEVAATTPAGGTYRLYGMTLHVDYNYN
jgi:hypothetical protein